MKERPIIFSAPMVRAILAGRKFQTRRVVKPKVVARAIMYGVMSGGPGPGFDLGSCPYGQPGDTLYVKETFQPLWTDADKPRDWKTGNGFHVNYPATDGVTEWHDENRGLVTTCMPSIFMPRWASRITLEVTGIRVEKLQDISEEDAKAEGMTLRNPRDISGDHGNAGYLISEFMGLWESINGPGSWDANPWVWIVEFRRVEAKSEAA